MTHGTTGAETVLYDLEQLKEGAHLLMSSGFVEAVVTQAR